VKTSFIIRHKNNHRPRHFSDCGGIASPVSSRRFTFSFQSPRIAFVISKRSAFIVGRASA
jgi:hypothetical protein